MAYVEMNYRSESMGRMVNIQIILPCNDGWEETQCPFKTLYFLPGMSADAKSLGTLLGIRLEAVKKGIAVVLVDGENSFYIDKPERKANYGRFVSHEIVEVTRMIFPLSHRREDTFLGGISMGGYGALYHGVKNNDIFGKIAVMSPGIYIEELLCGKKAGAPAGMFEDIFGARKNYVNSDKNLEKLIADKLDEKQTLPDIFMCCGTEDVLVYEQVCRFQNFLRESGLKVTYEETAGGHDVIYWEKILGKFFTYLIREQEERR